MIPPVATTPLVSVCQLAKIDYNPVWRAIIRGELPASRTRSGWQVADSDLPMYVAFAAARGKPRNPNQATAA